MELMRIGHTCKDLFLEPSYPESDEQEQERCGRCGDYYYADELATKHNGIWTCFPCIENILEEEEDELSPETIARLKAANLLYPEDKAKLIGKSVKIK